MVWLFSIEAQNIYSCSQGPVESISLHPRRCGEHVALRRNTSHPRACRDRWRPVRRQYVKRKRPDSSSRRTSPFRSTTAISISSQLPVWPRGLRTFAEGRRTSRRRVRHEGRAHLDFGQGPCHAFVDVVNRAPGHETTGHLAGQAQQDGFLTQSSTDAFRPTERR